MSDIIFQPKGTGTTIRNGAIVVNAPKGSSSAPANSGWHGTNYTIYDYSTSLPTTGTINASYSGRFDDNGYYVN